MIVLAATVLFVVTAYAKHPQLLVTADQHDAIVQKVETIDWASAAYAQLKTRIDSYVAKTEAEPDWVTSRLAMNWDTHYVRPLTAGSRTIGGEGRAPVPTPRFAGARDWATDYIRQTPIGELRPYNDRDGLILLINSTTGNEEWTETAITGHAIERINRELMDLAADAAFLYWVSGDVRYAEFATPILWTYMLGLSYVEPPVITDNDEGSSRIIGVTSYEVIHEQILHSIAVAYDFLYDHIQEQADIDGDVIEQGIKKIIDRVIAGGGRGGNWNLHQAKKIAYGGLVLTDDEAYEDGRGRSYYVDVVLNADLPQQLGLLHVIRQGYDQKTAVWPEAPGYAFDTTANIIELASLLSTDPDGRAVLEDPVVTRAILGQLNQLYPSGCSHGMGDTSYARFDTRAAELMLGWAMTSGDIRTAQALSAALQAEQAACHYDRGNQTNLLALTHYVSELPEADAESLKMPPTYFAEPINLVMLRSDSETGDFRYSLGAAMFGTRGGHMHANGLAVELYGAGQVLGVDSGRGSSYWQPDHSEYYSQAPAHNTVIVNGRSSYPAHGEGTIAMSVEAVLPAFGEEAGDSHLTFITGSFAYPDPGATQQRTLALVRIDDTTAFYFDVFRSKTDSSGPDQYHDWFYHGMADTVEVASVKLEPSALLNSAGGNMIGYDYFENEASLVTDATIRAHFPLAMGSVEVAMDVWVLGGEGRQIFTVEAPANRAARNYVEEIYWNRPTPTLVVRQKGEAWDRPFVAVYEPFLSSDGARVESVEAIGADSWRVSGDGWAATVTLNGTVLDLALDPGD